MRKSVPYFANVQELSDPLGKLDLELEEVTEAIAIPAGSAQRTQITLDNGNTYIVEGIPSQFIQLLDEGAGPVQVLDE